MLHNMKLQAMPFERIENGSKTIELRLYDDKRKLLNVGDIIEFLNIQDTTQKIRVEIVALHKFESFAQLYQSLPLEKCGYNQEELITAHSSDMNSYYSIEEQKKYGVIGIEIRMLDLKCPEFMH